MNVMISDLLTSVEVTGGWTVNVHDGSVPDHGYAVGGDPNVPERIIPSWRQMFGPVTHRIIRDHLRAIESAGAGHTGGWDDDGVLYLDAPTIIESRSQAVALGRKRGERAIYCLHTGETITL